MIAAAVVCILVIAGIGALVLIKPSTQNAQKDEFSMDSTGGTIKNQASTFEMQVPVGALPEEKKIAITGATPSNQSFVAGTAFSLGPDGLTFTKLVQLKISYDHSNIPSGTNESELKLATLVDGKWKIISASGANATSNHVCGVTEHFSTYAIVIESTKISIDGPFYADLDQRTPLSLTYLSSRPFPVAFYKEVWSIPSGKGNLLASGNGGNSQGPNATLYFNGINQTIALENLWYGVTEDVALGTVIPLSVDIYITFDFDFLNGTYYWNAHGESTIVITHPIVSILPSISQCTPGDQVPLTPSITKVAPEYSIKWSWKVNGTSGLLWEVGKDTNTTPGVTEIERSTAAYVIFMANPDATVGAEETVQLRASTSSLFITDEWYYYGNTAWANITIKAKAISIAFDYTNTIDIRYEEACTFSATTSGLPNGEKVYVWNTTGKYGGFGSDWPSNRLSYESSSMWAEYSSNGYGLDGDKDTITLSVYLKEGNTRTLLGNASASIEVYYPSTYYKLLDQTQSTGWVGSGSSWTVLIVGHHQIDWNGFYARKGDTISIACHYRGYVPDWESKDICLWQGSTMATLLSSGNIVTGGSWTFKVTI
jgi:hypothetical protein